jgi:hypothetical protein
MLLILSCGFSEGNSLLILFGNIFILIWNKKQNHKFYDITILFLIGLMAIIISFMAPGNYARESAYHDNHHFFHSLFFTFLQTFRFFFDWISNLPFILSMVLVLFFVAERKEKFQVLAAINEKVLILLIAVVFFFFIFPPYWSTGILGQHRTINVACFYFLILSFLFTATISFKFSEEIKKYSQVFKKFHVYFFITSFFCLATTRNGYTTITDILHNDASNYDKEMQHREETLAKAENKEKTILLKSLSTKPASLFVMDLSSDSAHWVNYFQAKYFGVKAIVCEEESSP